MQRSIKNYFEVLVGYFLRGLLVVGPLALTIYVVLWLIQQINAIATTVFDFSYPGLGILVMFLCITGVGILSSLLFVSPLLHFMDGILKKTPVVKIVYLSLKELFSAFVSDERKFNKPIMVRLTEKGPLRLGFITNENLTALNLPDDMVLVYLPHSYTVSGTHFIVPRRLVTPLEGVSSADVMRFIVSGGVTTIGRGGTTTHIDDE
jgi:uncharacterized membrane protein